MPFTQQTVDHLVSQRRIFMLINIAAAICIGILFWLIVDAQHRLDREDQLIQDQRYQTQLRDCRDLNRRHDHTVVMLRRLHVQGDVDLIGDQLFIRPLIETILPKRNCVKYAEVRVPNH
jgi:hypothetical protein